MRKTYLKWLSLFLCTGLFGFLFFFNASHSNKNGIGSKYAAIENLNISVLRASATKGYTITCDATNTSSCVINTPDGQGVGTGDQIFIPND